MALKQLSASEVSERLATLNGWKLEHGKLRKEYRFTSFIECFGFMTKVALSAESMQHHPEWFNVYNRVVVDLMTHDVQGISEKDFELAEQMDRYAAGQ